MRSRYRIKISIMPALPKVWLTMPFLPTRNGGQFPHLTRVNRSFVPVCHWCISALSLPLSKHNRSSKRTPTVQHGERVNARAAWYGKISPSPQARHHPKPPPLHVRADEKPV